MSILVVRAAAAVAMGRGGRERLVVFMAAGTSRQTAGGSLAATQRNEPTGWSRTVFVLLQGVTLPECVCVCA